MKTAFKLSIALNLGLLGIIAYHPQSQPTIPAGSRVSSQEPAAAQLGESGPGRGASSPAASEKPFRWSQLESPDYRVYVANLRRIGCPPQTVKDIIQADVGWLYATRRQELQLDGTAAGPWSFREEKQLVASLVDDRETIATRERPLTEIRSSPSPEPRLPLVFEPADYQAVGLNTAQAESIEALRAEFVEAIGGEGQNPEDPGYAERWHRAQPKFDFELRGLIGADAVARLEEAAALAETQAEGKPGGH